MTDFEELERVQLEKFMETDISLSFEEFQQVGKMLNTTEWIRVEDRLPEDETWVLVFNPEHGPTKNIAYYSSEIKGLGWSVEYNGNPADITHWMILPAKPSQ